MHTEYLIVGQGICGTFLAWELEKAGRSFIVVDESKPATASKVASGIINPVTGRRIVKTWMIDELLPFAVNSYRQIEGMIGIPCIEQKNIIDFFPTLQMKDAFLKRYDENPEYLSLPAEDQWKDQLFYDFGCGEIHPCYLVDLSAILTAFRQKWQRTGQLHEGKLELQSLPGNISPFVFGDISYEKIIFCDGINSTANPLFRNLPFAPNKGEALIVEITELARKHIYKKGNMVVPWKDNLFWVGSSHEWKFEHDRPTPAFYDRSVYFLRHFLRLPFRVLDHLAAVRPATLERRPFLGMHPLYPNTGIFNGMGTKGCSLAPYFAKQFVSHLTNKTSILPEADISRFNGILTRR